MKRMIASRFVLSEIGIDDECAHRSAHAATGHRCRVAKIRIFPSLISRRPNGGAAQPMSTWPDMTAVSVAAGPPVAVGFAFAPSSLMNATTMLFELEPLVE